LTKTKKLVLSLALVALLVVPLALSACGGGKMPTGPQNYSYNAYEPNEFVYEYGWQVWYAEQLKERTGGMMNFDVRPAGQFGYPLDKFIPVTGEGLVDFSNNMDGNESGNMPEFVMGSQPMLFDTYDQFEAYRVRMEPELKEYLLEKWNVVLIASAPMCDQSLMMAEPVRTLDDLKGKKIRVVSEAEGQFLKALGAVPVTVMFPELYSSFERGVIDGMTFYHMGLVDMKFYEVTKYVPIRTIRINWDLVVVNKDLWDTFPKEWQDTINGLHDEYLEYALADLKTRYEDSKKISEEHGVDFTQLPASEMAKAKEIARPIWDSYAQKYGDISIRALQVAKEVTGN
jgi:TRAP-type C4-dicarboxylate transport system substrate-binding protein